jgi:anti-anti-sigma factor
MRETLGEITRSAVVENLRELRQFVKGACETAGLDPEITADLTLAADEVCSNIIEHGYEAGSAGPITLALDVDATEVALTITDRGKPFPPEAAPEPDLESGWETRQIGGLGWHLIRQVVDRYEYATDAEGGNHLKLYKQLAASEKRSIFKGVGMEVTVDQQDSVSIVKVAGSVDSLTAGDLSESLAKEIESGAHQVVMDMSAVDYTSSAGLRALLGAVKMARERGGDFRLAAVQKLVSRVLELSGFTSILKSYDHVEEAVASFGIPAEDQKE